MVCCCRVSSGTTSSKYPDLRPCLMLPELSIAVGSCLQHSKGALCIKSGILCAASGIQEHGRGRLARPLGESAGHGAQQLPRQPTYPNTHLGDRLTFNTGNKENTKSLRTVKNKDLTFALAQCSQCNDCNLVQHFVLFCAVAMHSCVHNAVEQSDMTQACCVTTSETLIWWLTTISRPAFIFEAAWSTNFGISASPFISHHYCNLIAPLLL